MNKILNWTFGACFRTLGRFLAIFLVGALLLFVGSKLDIELPSWLSLNVNASEFQTVNTNFYNIFSGSTDVSISSDTNMSYKTTSNFETSKYYSLTLPSSKYLSIPSNSNYFYFQTYTYFWNGENSNVLNFNYNFNVGIYLNTWNEISCIQLSNTSEHNVGYITWKCPLPSNAKTINAIRFYGFEQQLDNVLDSPSNFRYGVYNWFMLFEVPETGSIIDNQQQTNDKLDDVNQSLEDTNQSIQDTNDNIMSSDSPNVSGMTDLAGYLPPGPLDSVLNLPLSILNSLNSKLSSSCTPLTLSLPFVNLPLNIPCLSTIFNQIAGLNILWESIGVILAALIMYKYLTYLYNWVDDVTSLRHTRARLFGAKSDADNWGDVE